MMHLQQHEYDGFFATSEGRFWIESGAAKADGALRFFSDDGLTVTIRAKDGDLLALFDALKAHIEGAARWRGQREAAQAAIRAAVVK